ncbi:hypothetical protein GBC03_05275 [Citrobacter telavivensis]|uniref:Uncharacterized protein n=1 Tax=Citrobacter telavivensis TaxID=2653932 RepID=A0A6L5EBN0_9ENTR|nr:hypothetical protein [Citrobacter telavivensis]QFS69657.1 hypothetical protein GBC03_05275 [Citrobacter telavivensis]
MNIQCYNLVFREREWWILVRVKFWKAPRKRKSHCGDHFFPACRRCMLFEKYSPLIYWRYM